MKLWPDVKQEILGLSKVLGELIRIQADTNKLQAETNKLLKQLSHDNSQFLSTLTSFLVHEDQRKMKAAITEEEQAKDRMPTKDDLRY